MINKQIICNDDRLNTIAAKKPEQKKSKMINDGMQSILLYKWL